MHIKKGFFHFTPHTSSHVFLPLFFSHISLNICHFGKKAIPDQNLIYFLFFVIDSFLFISYSRFQEGRSTYQPQETNSIRGFSLRGPSETIREEHREFCHVIKSPSTQQFPICLKFSTNHKSYSKRIYFLYI